VDEIELPQATHMESRIHFAGTCTLSGRTAAISNGDANVHLDLLLPKEMTFFQDKHINLKPGHLDPESLEVDYLKIDIALVSVALADVRG
jgi:hypothetical protein